MKNKLLKWQVFGAVFTGIMGVLLHFLYEWSGENIFVSLISAVNESIWEHTKLIFFPMLFFGIIEYTALGKDFKSFVFTKTLGALLGITLIPALYYIINGVFGPTADWINIAIFFVTVAVVYLIETALLKKDKFELKPAWLPFVILTALVVLYIIFTFFPPQIPLFIEN